MASINNVARHILSNYKSLTTMKLQKLVFYSQAHALATTGHPLFESDFQAWRGGPVAVDLYHLHRGKFFVSESEIPDRGTELTENEIRIVDQVRDELGSLSGRELSERTHSEQPWIGARRNLGPGDPGNVVITKESMTDYYRLNPVITPR
ncbi:Panacea domain-containing protein [Arcanobacterium buesumense]|uniref:SocA family protein n=1 Tax=Arcanobacterium buesumense TaxID=2722751 RepID=A0A6H2EMS9_9ACTO|nr:type II toxin-antitoxin system antitoxin SocA domain-containing protein [Arcanobacterium buesumense]QJC22380.1 SocA family protein [Arcanobacterium buesumense]